MSPNERFQVVLDRLAVIPAISRSRREDLLRAERNVDDFEARIDAAASRLEKAVTELEKSVA